VNSSYEFTDANGIFVLTFIATVKPGDTIRLRVQDAGYETYDENVVVPSGGKLPKPVQLRKTSAVGSAKAQPTPPAPASSQPPVTMVQQCAPGASCEMSNDQNGNAAHKLEDGNIYENQPNKLEGKDPGTTFTNNTVRNMDASVSNGARADNNLLEGKSGTAVSPTVTGSKGADSAAINAAQTRNQYPGGFPDAPNATPTREKQPQAAPSGIIPPGIIPEDPEMAVQAVTRMRNTVADVLGKKDTITFLMSWPDDDSKYLAFVSSLFSSACRTEPRQCWFTQPANVMDLDRPRVPNAGRRGITIHGPDARALAIALSAWFTTYDTSTFPHELDGYKEATTKEIIWVEMGPGSPWKPTTK